MSESSSGIGWVDGMWYLLQTHGEISNTFALLCYMTNHNYSIKCYNSSVPQNLIWEHCWASWRERWGELAGRHYCSYPQPGQGGTGGHNWSSCSVDKQRHQVCISIVLKPLPFFTLPSSSLLYFIATASYERTGQVKANSKKPSPMLRSPVQLNSIQMKERWWGEEGILDYWDTSENSWKKTIAANKVG